MSLRELRRVLNSTVETPEFALQFLEESIWMVQFVRGGASGVPSKFKLTIILKQLGAGVAHLCNLGVHQ